MTRVKTRTRQRRDSLEVQAARADAALLREVTVSYRVGWSNRGSNRVGGFGFGSRTYSGGYRENDRMGTAEMGTTGTIYMRHSLEGDRQG